MDFGDSRAILVQKDCIIEALSEDHRPNNENEEKLIWSFKIGIELV